MLNRESDLLGRLPPEAREFFETLLQRQEDARALVRVATEAAREAREDLRVTQQQLSYTMGAVQRDEAAERGLRRTRDVQGAELAKRQRLVAEREAALQPVATLVAALVEQLGGVGPDFRFVPFEGPVAKGRRGESPAGAIERIRAEIAGLDADRARVQVAPRPRDVLLAELRAAVEALGARGRPDVAGIISGRPGASLWPTLSPLQIGMLPKDTPFVPSSAVDAGALLAWLAPDQIIERLEQELDRELGDTQGLGDDERHAQLSALDSQRLTLERDEEAAIRAAEDGGQAIARRPNANALAVLSLALAPALPVDVDDAPKMAGVDLRGSGPSVGVYWAA